MDINVLFKKNCSQFMGGSPGNVSEKSCDVGEAKEGLENEL